MTTTGVFSPAGTFSISQDADFPDEGLDVELSDSASISPDAAADIYMSSGSEDLADICASATPEHRIWEVIERSGSRSAILAGLKALRARGNTAGELMERAAAGSNYLLVGMAARSSHTSGELLLTLIGSAVQESTAAAALANLLIRGGDEARSSLKKALSSPHVNVRMAVAGCNVTPGSLLLQIVREDSSVPVALASYLNADQRTGIDRRALMRAAAQSLHPELRMLAARSPLIDDDSLAERLNDPDIDIAKTAFMLLTRRQLFDRSETLALAAKSPYVPARREAARSRLTSDEILLALITDEHAGVACDAFSGLMLRNADIIAVMAQVARSPHSELRLAAAEAPETETWVLKGLVGVENLRKNCDDRIIDAAVRNLASRRRGATEKSEDILQCKRKLLQGFPSNTLRELAANMMDPDAASLAIEILRQRGESIELLKPATPVAALPDFVPTAAVSAGYFADPNAVRHSLDTQFARIRAQLSRAASGTLAKPEIDESDLRSHLGGTREQALYAFELLMQEEFDLMKRLSALEAAFLSRHREVVEEAARHCLSADYDYSELLLNMFRGSNLETALTALDVLRSKDYDEKLLMAAAAESPKKQLRMMAAGYALLGRKILLKLYEDRHDEVSDAALGTLVALGVSRGALADLASRSASWHARFRAARSDMADADALFTLLEDGDDRVREAAFQALESRQLLENEDDLLKAAGTRFHWQARLKAARKICDVIKLLELSLDREPQVAAAAFVRLRELKFPEVELMMKAAVSPHPEVRMIAAGSVATPSAQMESLARDQDSRVRGEAQNTLLRRIGWMDNRGTKTGD